MMSPEVQGVAEAKLSKSYLKKENTNKKGCVYGSSSKALCLSLGPGFIPSTMQKEIMSPGNIVVILVCIACDILTIMKSLFLKAYPYH
jgi:hypothetical protein